jgi:hypothetical protein
MRVKSYETSAARRSLTALPPTGQVQVMTPRYDVDTEAHIVKMMYPDM